MPATPPTIFISYRRDDTHAEAAAIECALADFFGGLSKGQVQVFRDEGGIPASRQWLEEITRAIDGAWAVIVLIGTRWLSSRDALGRARLRDPKDILRREVEYAIKRHKRIVPLLIGQASMPASGDLPRSLQPLTNHQALSLERDGMPMLTAVVTTIFAEISAQQRAEADLQEREDLAVLEAGAAENGPRLIADSWDPAVAGDDFRDMPLYGRWEIDISAPSRPGFLGLAARAHSLNITLRDDYTVVGTLTTRRTGLGRLRGAPTQRLAGTWWLRLGSRAELVLGVFAVLDRGGPYEVKMPIAQRRGDGYSGRDADGRSYFYTSLGGRTQADKDRPEPRRI